MARTTGLARELDIVNRWRKLAEQRLDHLNELYETGRWRRYHTEQAFVDNIRDAKRAVEAWRLLAKRDDGIAPENMIAEKTKPIAFDLSPKKPAAAPTTMPSVSSASLLPQATLTPS